MPSSYLSDTQIQRLKEHKYSCEGTSITEKYIFQPFWSWIATFVPLWVAPNLITVTGLAFNIATSLLVILYSPQANKHSIPSFVFILCALGLFIYQTLDAVDGKHARRTNTSSPLGELFDHGCDAISTIFVTTSLCCAVSLGTYPNHLFFFFISISTYYYLAFWQYYCSGKLIFNKVDVTEALVFSMIIYLVAGIIGPQLFLSPLILFGYTVNILKISIVINGVITSTYFCLTFFRIFTRQNWSTVGQTHVLTPGLPLAVIFACAFYVFKCSREDLFESHPCLFMLTFGNSLAKLVCNLIIAAMSRSSFQMIDVSLVGPCVLVLYIFSGETILPSLGIEVVSEYYVLVGIAVFTLAQFLLYIVCICREVSRGLMLNVFTIPYKKDE